VALDGAHRHVELGRDLGVRSSGLDECEDLGLAGGDAERDELRRDQTVAAPPRDGTARVTQQPANAVDRDPAPARLVDVEGLAQPSGPRRPADDLGTPRESPPTWTGSHRRTATSSWPVPSWVASTSITSRQSVERCRAQRLDLLPFLLMALDLLDRAGCTDVRVVERTWPVPLGFVVGRKP
jgi:hypothetical protein